MTRATAHTDTRMNIVLLPVATAVRTLFILKMLKRLLWLKFPGILRWKMSALYVTFVLIILIKAVRESDL